MLHHNADYTAYEGMTIKGWPVIAVSRGEVVGQDGKVSVRAHLYGRDDGLTTAGPVLERFAPFRDFLDVPADPAALKRLRAAESVGRPLGDKAFLTRLERATKRTLRPRKRGRKPRPQDDAQQRLI